MDENKKNVFPQDAVNWDELEAIGIYRDELETNGELELLLNGQRTNPVNLRLMMLGIDIDMDATLRLILQGETYIVEINGITPDPLN